MNEKLMKVFESMDTKLNEIKAISLSTIDGFSVCTYCAEGFDVADDKLSAVSCSLTALSNAAAQQLIGADLQSTCIETESGTMILVNTKNAGKDYVLCFITGKNQNIGKARYFAHKLSKYITNSLVIT